MQKMIINIDDKLYARLLNNGVVNHDDAVNMAKSIRKGILLSKGHGDIVDIETLIERFWDGYSMEITKDDLPTIKSIIKADKGNEVC